jgi:hypothetical protein
MACFAKAFFSNHGNDLALVLGCKGSRSSVNRDCNFQRMRGFAKMLDNHCFDHALSLKPHGLAR